MIRWKWNSIFFCHIWYFERCLHEFVIFSVLKTQAILRARRCGAIWCQARSVISATSKQLSQDTQLQWKFRDLERHDSFTTWLKYQKIDLGGWNVLTWTNNWRDLLELPPKSYELNYIRTTCYAISSEGEIIKYQHVYCSVLKAKTIHFFHYKLLMEKSSWK